jgi:hypothetical protein
MPGSNGYKANVRIRVESAMLVRGPAIAVFPAVSLFMEPAIITAPGEMILKSGRKIEKAVISAPNKVSRNSAHKPKYCAVNLWASSCKRNVKVNTITRIAKTSGVLGISSDPYKTMDSPTPMTSKALRVRCRISVELNRKGLSIGGA